VPGHPGVSLGITAESSTLTSIPTLGTPQFRRTPTFGSAHGYRTTRSQRHRATDTNGAMNAP